MIFIMIIRSMTMLMMVYDYNDDVAIDKAHFSIFIKKLFVFLYKCDKLGENIWIRGGKRCGYD